LRRGSPFAPDVDPIISHHIHQDDGQKGGEGAPAFPTAEDPVVVLDEPEESPGAELLCFMLGQAAALAQAAQLLLNELEVLLKESLPPDRRSWFRCRDRRRPRLGAVEGRGEALLRGELDHGSCDHRRPLGKAPRDGNAASSRANLALGEPLRPLEKLQKPSRRAQGSHTMVATL